MQTENVERSLRAALHETLDHAQGPHAAWAGSPASRRVAELERRGRWPFRALAAAAVIGTLAGAALLAGTVNQPTPTPATPSSAPSEAPGIFAGVGGWIAYGGSNFSAIWAIDPARPGDQDARVMLSSQRGTPMAWSPDGSKLLVLRYQINADNPEQLTLVVLNADGTETRLAAAGQRSGAAFTPDGSHVVYGDGSNIYIIDAEGGTPEILLAADPPWWRLSPDGTQIAYLDWGGGDHSHSLSVMQTDGSGARVVTDDPRIMGAGHLRGPGVAWSPDGKQIVFATEYAGVWIVGIDGSGLKELASGDFEGSDPHWSPDGSLISYNDGRQLIIARPDGTRVRTSSVGRSGPWNPAGMQPSTPSPGASPSSKPTSGAMWPQASLAELYVAQQRADAGDPLYTWQLEDLSGHLGQGGPFREAFYRRFLEEKLGWEDFHWTLGDSLYLDLPGVYFLRCAPSPADVFLDGGDCEPSIGESRYETVHLNVAQPVRTGPGGIWVVTSWELVEPYERPAPLEPDVEQLLTDFIAARVAGAGAEAYLDDPKADVPLLYATTSGLRYESGGFSEARRQFAWPYGLRAFHVWLEIDDGLVVVNQLLFMPPDGRRRLIYVSDGFGTDLAPTIEDGAPVAAPYDAFDGNVTLLVAHPWVFRGPGGSIQLVPDDPGTAPTTDGGERVSWNRLVLLADPHCPAGPAPSDAEALAERLRSDPGLDVSAPIAVGGSGTSGLRMDITLATGERVACWPLAGEGWPPGSVSLATGGRMRLYLFNAPAGSSMQMLAVAFVVPEPQFERAAAADIAVEFHIP